MNAVDRIVAWISPTAGLRRVAARRALAGYDAAKPSKQRKFHRDSQSPNALVASSAAALRAQARNLERNHDIARGIVRTLVNNIVGPQGIGIEPQPRTLAGEIHEEYAAALRVAWRDWCRRPEVSHVHHWARLQRLMARAWIRDGECFASELIGPVAHLDHGTRVPYSLEVFEADRIPHDYTDGERIAQGVEVNAWGRPVAWYAWKNSPLGIGVLPQASNLKRLSADNVLHLATIDRLGQLRGVSEFASVIGRLEDIKDYEESERIAAKVAAALTAYVKRGTPDMYPSEDATPRDLSIAPGMIIDSLGVGEEIGLIDSKRPNPAVAVFRQGQLRAVACGVGASYSSTSRDYNGTYSAQRQELVEQWVNYAVLTDEFVGQVVQPVWERFVAVAHLSGVVKRPREVTPERADDALFVGQSMPWIDPLKEANAWRTLTRAGFASEIEVLRKRGVNPRDVLEQIAAWRKQTAERGLRMDSDAASDAAASPAHAEQETEDEDEAPEDRASREEASAAMLRIVAASMENVAGAVASAVAAAPAPVVHVAAPAIDIPPTVVNLSPEIHNHLPVPDISIETPPASVVVAHPSRAVQTVERDPETKEVLCTVTDYTSEGAS